MKNKDFKDLLNSIDQAREMNLQCPNCLRSMPCKEHKRGKGCKWCTKP